MAAAATPDPPLDPPGARFTYAAGINNNGVVAGSYLGTAVETPAMAAADGNGHRVDPALMEIVSVRVPAKVKRALEQRAEAEGRPTGAVAIELLEKVDRQ